MLDIYQQFCSSVLLVPNKLTILIISTMLGNFICNCMKIRVFCRVVLFSTFYFLYLFFSAGNMHWCIIIQIQLYKSPIYNCAFIPQALLHPALWYINNPVFVSRNPSVNPWLDEYQDIFIELVKRKVWRERILASPFKSLAINTTPYSNKTVLI